MSKRQLSALLGLWVIVFLFLGFPIGWDKWIAVVSGILVILVAYKKVGKVKTPSHSAFVQSNVQGQNSVEKVEKVPEIKRENETTANTQ